ncbi:allantoinase [Kineosphaera limosa]|uniref:allantoinase n=1 Tax=Kineosphaera limosa NBRC 100340 TaxID=1184609 RepID=K6W8W9_9MICO|nr:allantoinase AllB [Kineosphaera limosa]NYD99685.1 allantoinase [Kineosphaera limosa]GAB95640.1 putative allantoinase [Kineosphaera limosa NBRC 100340]
MTQDPRLSPLNSPGRVREQIAEYVAQHGRPEPAADSPARADDGLDLVVRGAQVLTPAGVGAFEVGVRDGRIVAVEPLGAGLVGDTVRELADDEVLLPGLVDAHVHVNEPGRTQWEGFATATRAAAAGGVTTILDMPLNSIPSTVNAQALEFKQLVAAPQAFVDVGFWGGAVPGNRTDLRELHEAGVFGFKCFLLHSGVDEFPPLDADELEDYLTGLAEVGGMMIVHAEDNLSIDRAPQAGGAAYSRFLASRPRGAENLAIATVIERARWTGAKVHILHLSSSDALPMIRSAKADGIDLSVETCPHYLTLAAEGIPDGATAYKCCPPIREGHNSDALWEGLLDGTIDYIASDHSPSTLDLKELESGDFGAAWGGIASVQLTLPVIWTAARERGIDLARVAHWMAAAPAQRVGLSDKGSIEVGRDGDLAVFAPEESFTVKVAELHHRNPLSPYDGKQLFGRVRSTYLRGTEVDFETPAGRLLRRA